MSPKYFYPNDGENLKNITRDILFTYGPGYTILHNFSLLNQELNLILNLQPIKISNLEVFPGEYTPVCKLNELSEFFQKPEEELSFIFDRLARTSKKSSNSCYYRY